jgi:predicted site-specific integrase-resolvase
MSEIAASKARKRCAVYCRVSTDERLDQEFNSIDAQKEAGLASIASQRAEGWIAVPDDYIDPGFSGGNLERPGLKRLLADIEAGKIDIVVVYKIDRLTRSLTDFSRLIEVFERNKVSFVAVTQQFNTTTSMGRSDAQRPAVLRAIRTRGHRRAHPRQDRGCQAQGDMDGWRAAAGVRRRKPPAGHQRSRGGSGAAHLRGDADHWLADTDCRHPQLGGRHDQGVDHAGGPDP